MSEVVEVPRPQPEQEKGLTKEELRIAVDELNELFQTQFENSVVKRYGRPGPAKVIPEGGRGTFSSPYRDPRILIYAPPTEYDEKYKNESSWKVDRSVENTLEFVRGKGNIRETYTIIKGDSPSIRYKFKDMQYNKSKPKQPDRQSEDNQATYDIGKEILASMPQVKN